MEEGRKVEGSCPVYRPYIVHVLKKRPRGHPGAELCGAEEGGRGMSSM